MALSLIKTCNSEEAKSLMDPQSTCRTVIVPRGPLEKSSSCSGIYNQSYPCKVNFSTKLGIVEISIICTKNNQPVSFDSFSGEILGFNVAAVIKKDDGKEVVINDPGDYVLITSDKLEIGIVEKKIDGLIKKESYISNLTNVSCI